MLSATPTMRSSVGNAALTSVTGHPAKAITAKHNGRPRLTPTRATKIARRLRKSHASTSVIASNVKTPACAALVLSSVS